uniref:Superoxide dismutase copper/zinc binding domain-containing protein n=1 Tax=Latimeria chalumnae TaxID=7897 RepID=H3AAW4_LATCH
QFPVMYGHFVQPCQESNIGDKIYSFTGKASLDNMNLTDLFQLNSSLVDLTMVVETCSNKTKACTVIRKDGKIVTWQTKFFSPVAGDIYIRQNIGEVGARVLTNLATLSLSSTINFHLVNLGSFKVSHPFKAQKSRSEVDLHGIASFVLMDYKGNWSCANLHELKSKTVSAIINMKGVKGYFNFSQTSPFDSTEIKVSLRNLNYIVGLYHIHLFPVPQRKTSQENLCSTDNTGGHWNPFGLDMNSSSYPKNPGGTHDQYEVGDLSGKHGSLKNLVNYKSTFIDWNLPCFGNNSIVDRSVVIHKTDGSRLLCGNLRYQGDEVTAIAVFKDYVVGRIMFKQMRNNPYSDLSIFLELSYSNSSASTTHNHQWHVHEYAISSETDFEPNMCLSTKGHFNPFHVDKKNNYSTECSYNPFNCEVGDYAGRHMAINLTNHTRTVHAKNFFTDTMSALSGIRSILGRSIVIHAANNNPKRIACANITVMHLALGKTGPWFGKVKASGKLTFLQNSDLDLTQVNVSLTNLRGEAGGYHVHVLPLKTNSSDICADAKGHFNPFSVNKSASPAFGNGTSDQYEVGDLSGRFGTLKGQSSWQQLYEDNNLPLFGPRSIMGRSLVIHYINGSR